jgi:hypothetical protein
MKNGHPETIAVFRIGRNNPENQKRIDDKENHNKIELHRTFPFPADKVPLYDIFHSIFEILKKTVSLQTGNSLIQYFL